MKKQKKSNAYIDIDIPIPINAELLGRTLELTEIFDFVKGELKKLKKQVKDNSISVDYVKGQLALFEKLSDYFDNKLKNINDKIEE